MSSSAPVVRHLDDVLPMLISPADTVRLATLVRPSDGTETSVFFEVWEPSGAQPKARTNCTAATCRGRSERSPRGYCSCPAPLTCTSGWPTIEAELRNLRSAELAVIPGIWGHRAGNPAGIPAELDFLTSLVRAWLDA